MGFPGGDTAAPSRQRPPDLSIERGGADPGIYAGLVAGGEKLQKTFYNWRLIPDPGAAYSDLYLHGLYSNRPGIVYPDAG